MTSATGSRCFPSSSASSLYNAVVAVANVVRKLRIYGVRLSDKVIFKTHIRRSTLTTREESTMNHAFITPMNVFMYCL
jgi:hypothetical protein